MWFHRNPMNQSQPQSGYGVGQPMGRIELNLSFFPLAFILFLVTPIVAINRQPQPRPWGRHAFDLPAGQYEVFAAFPYMFSDRCGPAQLIVPVYAGYVTVVTYEAPFFMFSNGTMRIVNTMPMQPHQLRG